MLLPKIRLDFETFSRAPLKKVGAYKYAEHPSTRVLIYAVQQQGSDEVLTWDVRQPPNEATALLLRAIEEKWEIHAFNAQFEWTILKYVCPRQFGFPIPDINTMRCTAAVCRSAGLPPSLAKSAVFLNLPMQKDVVGMPLIRTFSVPDKKLKQATWETEGLVTIAGEKMTYADAFQKFVDYCAQDVRTELAVAEMMQAYELKGFPLAWFQLDMRLNDRGVPVDLVALNAARDMYKEKEKTLSEKFREITGLSPSQRDRCFEWFKENGYKQPKLDAANRAIALQSPSLAPHVKEALLIKDLLGYAAIKKIPSMIAMAMEDGFVRGSFLWCGAQKTWRWTSKIPQWQNMKKAAKWLRPMIEDIYQTLRNKEVDLDIFEFVYGDAYEIIASLARYFVRFEDRNLLDLDYASVEARILPAIIESARIMNKIKTGGDIYTSTGDALSIELKSKFNVPFEINRDVAKTIVLATQFQGGWHAVFTATGNKWKRKWCETAVQIVRKENPEFPKAWRAFQDAFVQAIDNPHKWIEATKYVSFAYVKKAPFPRVLMRLASGRKITYPYPEKKEITMVKVVTTDPVTNQETGVVWERLDGVWDDEAAIAKKLSLGDAFIRPDATAETWFLTHELSFYGHVKDKLYGRVSTYGGDLLQSCFTRDTPVMTKRGWVCIAEVTHLDEVWDGESWVSTQGCVSQGVKPVIDFEGVTCTPDHKFMVDNCWVAATSIPHEQAASQSQKLTRDEIWSINCGGFSPPRKENELGCPMRLRKRENNECRRPSEIRKTRGFASLLSKLRVQRVSKRDAQPLQASYLLYTRLDDVALLSRSQRFISLLRETWDSGVQKMAQARELFCRYATQLQKRLAVRKAGCEWQLHPQELLLGHCERAIPESKENSFYGNPKREDAPHRSRRSLRGELHDGIVSKEARLGGRTLVGEAEVFDLVNCGSNHRFTVLTANGPLIAHNCTQGTGADLLAYGSITADEAGFAPFMLVHDQVLAPDNGDKDGFEKAMCKVPEWFEGFPLEADADIVRSYCKN